jgi:endonuclease/exonuclease/phosphatase family metal-dependent hydrolase
MRVATWNVERLKRRRDLSQIGEACNQAMADIFVLTETDFSLDVGFKFCSRTPPPSGEAVSYRNTESRVSICTNYEIVKQHETFDEQTAICAELSTTYGNLLVYGVVIGIYGNRHNTYMEDLLRISADISRLAADGASICVCGDFNCSFSDNYYFTKSGRITLEEMCRVNDIELLTLKQKECIDHIAISRSFLGAVEYRVAEWNADKMLSDHKGIVAEVYGSSYNS